MADDLGPINPVSQHFLNRRARQEAYQGHHKKHQEPEPHSPDVDDDAVAEEGAGKPAEKSHIDVRI